MSDINLEQISQVVLHYSKACQVSCRIIDESGETLFAAKSPGLVKNDEICESLSKQASQICRNAHLYGSYQSERLGGQYVYFCPLGLTHWASPIIRQGQVAGTLIGGPVHLVDPEELDFEDLQIRLNVSDRVSQELRAQIRRVPVISGDRVNSLSEILCLTARSLSDPTFDQLEQKRKSGDLQSELWQQINFLKEFSYVDPGQQIYPLEKEELLLEKIASGDKEASQLILNEMLGHIFFSSSGDVETMRARVVELVVLLSRAAIRGGADVEQIFGLNYTYLGKLYSFNSIDQIAFWLSGIMTRFTEQVFNLSEVKHADVIYRACDYVKKNYMKRLTLEETADMVYLSPAYFSRIFKDEMGTNFNAYVNQYRVEAARKLLLNEAFSLTEIASQVGFEGQSYFSKVFKKMTGVTPGKYRESRGRTVAAQG